MTVLIVPYRPEWPAEFELIAAEIRSALAHLPIVGVEHVGSTSVPGLPAKPIIDIDIIVQRPVLPDTLAPLESIGYVYKGEEGIPDRHIFVHAPSRPADDGEHHTGVDTAASGPPRTSDGRSLHLRNVYVAVAGSKPIRNHLGVRDVLRRDKALRDEYAAIKLALAGEDRDIYSYIREKSTIIQKLLVASGSLTEQECKEILDHNMALEQEAESRKGKTLERPTK